jgi:hypothetical protein
VFCHNNILLVFKPHSFFVLSPPLEEARLLITENMDGHINKEQSNAQLESLWQAARQETKGIVGEAGLHPSFMPRELDAG